MAGAGAYRAERWPHLSFGYHTRKLGSKEGSRCGPQNRVNGKLQQNNKGEGDFILALFVCYPFDFKIGSFNLYY